MGLYLGIWRDEGYTGGGTPRSKMGVKTNYLWQINGDLANPTKDVLQFTDTALYR